MPGYKFIEALERFTDPVCFSELRAQINLAQFHIDSQLRNRRLSELTAPLTSKLFERLWRRELLASAMSFSPSVAEHTIILPRETFKMPGLIYNWGWNTLEAPGFVFRNVEFFTWEDPPLPLVDQVSQLERPTSALLSNPIPAGTGQVAAAAFWHDATYEHVTWQGREFYFSKLQSSIVERLHAASIGSQPWLHLDDLREMIGFQTSQISGLFRRQEHWRELIASDRRGNYRLRDPAQN